VTLERVIPVFFLQGEDGIRAYLVTGVQTCALPVSLADAGGDVGARAVLVPGLAADRALDAVRDRGGRDDAQLGRDDRRVVRLQRSEERRVGTGWSAGGGGVGV